MKGVYTVEHKHSVAVYIAYMPPGGEPMAEGSG